MPSTRGVGGCSGLKRIPGLAAFDSPIFTSVAGRMRRFRLATASSSVLIFPHAAVATADLAARGRTFRACFGRAIGADGTRLVSLRALAAPLPVAGSFASRATLMRADPPRVAGARVPTYEDTLGFVRGRAEVFLRVTADRRPFSTSGERRLLGLLYSRANTQRLG